MFIIALLTLTVRYYAHIHTTHVLTSRKCPTFKFLKTLKIINNKGFYSFSILFYYILHRVFSIHQYILFLNTNLFC